MVRNGKKIKLKEKNREYTHRDIENGSVEVRRVREEDFKNQHPKQTKQT